MYAIVEINGQQFKAEAGQKLFVHHIEGAENGSTVEFEKVLLVDKDGNVTVGAPTVEGAKVVCQVVSNLVKGDKVLVFQKVSIVPFKSANVRFLSTTSPSICMKTGLWLASGSSTRKTLPGITRRNGGSSAISARASQGDVCVRSRTLSLM